MENGRCILSLGGVVWLNAVLIGLFIARTGAILLVRPFKKLTNIEVLNTFPDLNATNLQTTTRSRIAILASVNKPVFISALEHI